MKWCVVVAAALLLALAAPRALACGPGRGAGRRRGPRKLTPLVFKQHVPNVPENTLTASGLTEGRIDRNDSRFKDLVPNYSPDIMFKDEEGTGADRLMTQRCKEKVNTLAISVMNQWPGVQLMVTEAWDEEGHHTANSLHYEGRAVDITTSDRDRSKYGMLARLAVEAGFDWVYYESRAHIHCSVKSESSQAAKYGGCFTGDTSVTTPSGERRSLSDLHVGEKILTLDAATKRLVFSEVILFLDYNPSDKREFFEIALETGRTLTVTPYHLVTLKDDRTVYVADLKTGDKLLVSDSDNKLVEDTIVRIDLVFRTGVFAPLTKTGTVVVNDVVMSCYATVDSQSLAHWAFMPLRLFWNINVGVHRLWSVFSKPVQSWQFNEIATAKPKVGVHWYARMLYATADYIIPSHLHK
ncbi:sonic hedgehog protein [Cylas formicarius]|uniref:sonic hedgehog protein n=1 Tax=Cylas formicarius TaxID=197179 RepID=UPI0029583AFF|nr:sonic hedgehog protein [Cylas formicarius]XP_060524096.1 sonic hedgehog protein [Cylas formicarius]